MSNQKEKFEKHPCKPNDYLPARMLNEFVYCPRLFYLEHVDGLFQHNSDTLDGAAKHKRVDGKTDELKPSNSQSEDASPLSTDNQNDFDEVTEHLRSVTLSSETYGIIAKMDLIEAKGNQVIPVDYKRGSPKTELDGTLTAWDPEKIQLCAQALVLREHGFRCDEGIIYFLSTKQRVRIPIDVALTEKTILEIQKAKKVRENFTLPKPLVNSSKCERCSLVSICLPDETVFYDSSPNSSEMQQDYSQFHDGQQLLLFNREPDFQKSNIYNSFKTPTKQPIKPRQLVAARDERRPLYLNTQGLSVGISGKVLQVKEKRKLVQKVRLHDINQVNLFGNIQVTTQAIGSLLAAEIPLIYFSFGGWFKGMTQPVGLKNIIWRQQQFRAADNDEFCLELAKALVIGKIRNQRTMLMRNHIEPDQHTLGHMKSLGTQAGRCTNQEKLLGVEGMAARCYFQQLSGMIKLSNGHNQSQPDDTGKIFSFDFLRRNRRPPRDPVNALLSLGYSLLSKDFTVACAATGLDPYLGFYHKPRFGRPSLALDLMEPFRPIIVDSAVLSAINQKMLSESDFISAGNSVALTPNGRKSFYRAYEHRMNEVVRHPVLGYRVSYRRLLEIQTRLLARVLMNELDTYPVFTTR